MAPRVPPLHTCVRDGQIICPDDLCRGSSTTLCGLEEGIDFGTGDEWEDYYEDFEEVDD